MNRYTIYCTEEQTKKAIELGAPIISFKNAFTSKDIPHLKIVNEGNWTLYFIPTAEQMIGWLEEQGFKFKIYEKFENSWYYCVWYRTRREPIREFDNLKSRKKATLAAIDAALEYLMNNKE